jgi:CheY-like chemotaxis protein
MAKIMLVEDDNNLREIYGARLLAEGYEIVSAKDGEEALALAVKEKPDLIISDVMMPKISGFDMLDILRSTEGIKHTKVIMMTALSQAEDRARANKLGADMYLVKSQVTLEDVAKAVHEVLEGPKPAGPVGMTDEELHGTSSTVTATAIPTPVDSTPMQTPAPVADPAPVAASPIAEPAAQPLSDPAMSAAFVTPVGITPPLPPKMPEPMTTNPTPAVDPVMQSVEELMGKDPSEDSLTAPALPAIPNINPASQQSTTDENSAVQSQIADFANAGANQGPAPEAPLAMQPDMATNDDRPVTKTVNGKKVISPVTDMNARPSLNDLLDKEVAKQEADAPVLNPTAGGLVASVAPAANLNSPVAPDLTQADLASLPGVTTESATSQPVVLPVASEPIDTTPQMTAPSAPATTPGATPAIDPNSIAL